MKIEVTAADIRNARRGVHSAIARGVYSQWCPVARALRRAFGRPVSVCGYCWRFVGSDTTYSLPAQVESAVRQFDSRPDMEMEPFTFIIRRPRC